MSLSHLPNLASNADKIPSNLQNWYKDQTFTASSLRDGAISLAKDITVNGVSGVRNMYYNIIYLTTIKRF